VGETPKKFGFGNGLFGFPNFKAREELFWGILPIGTLSVLIELPRGKEVHILLLFGVLGAP